MAYPPPTPLPAQVACATASEPAPLCIVVLGDSTAAGVPLTGDDRWWVRLEDSLEDALPERQVSVHNWAIPRGRVEVVESAASDQPELESFDIAIILEGVNDIGNRGTEDWASHYTAAVERLEERGLQVIVAAPPPDLEEGELQSRHDEIDDVVRNLANAERPVLDIAARFRGDGDAAKAYYHDSLHQSDAGQRVIAEMATELVLGLASEE